MALPSVAMSMALPSALPSVAMAEEMSMALPSVAMSEEMMASSLPAGHVSIPVPRMPSSGSGKATASWRAAKRKASSQEAAPTEAEAPSRSSAAPARAEQAPSRAEQAPAQPAAEPPVVLPSESASEAAVEEVAAAATESREASGANRFFSAITRCSVCGTGKKGPKNSKSECDDWKCPDCRPPLDPNAEGEAEAEARVAEAARKQAGEPAPSPEASMNHLRSAMGLSPPMATSVLPSVPALLAVAAAGAPACTAAELNHAVPPPPHRPAAATTNYAAAGAAANAAAAHEAAAAIAAAAAATVTAEGVFSKGTPRSTAGASSRLHRWRLVRGDETWVLSATPTYEIEDGIEPYVLQPGEERLSRSSLVRRLSSGGFEAKRLTWEHSEHFAKVFGPRLVREARQVFTGAHKAAAGRAEGQPSGLLEVVRQLLLIECHVEVEAMRGGHWTAQKRESWLKLVLKATRPSERMCENLSHSEVVLQQVGKFADAIAALTPAFLAGFDHWKERLQLEAQRQACMRQDAQIRDVQIRDVQAAKRRRSCSQADASPMEAPDTFDGTVCLGLLAELCDGLVHWQADAGQLA